jgi:hypothetical protein
MDSSDFTKEVGEGKVYQELDWSFFLLVPVAVLCFAISSFTIRGTKIEEGDTLGNLRAGATFVCLCGLSQLLLSLVYFIVCCSCLKDTKR